MDKKYKGCEIEFDEGGDCFIAYKNGEIFAQNPSLKRLKTDIDMLLKKSFERLPIYWHYDEDEIIEGEITSFNSIEKEVWVSYGREKQREKVNLKGDKKRILHKTKENLVMLEKIKNIYLEIERLEKEKEKLSEMLTNYSYAELCKISGQTKLED